MYIQYPAYGKDSFIYQETTYQRPANNVFWRLIGGNPMWKTVKTQRSW